MLIGKLLEKTLSFEYDFRLCGKKNINIIIFFLVLRSVFMFFLFRFYAKGIKRNSTKERERDRERRTAAAK